MASELAMTFQVASCVGVSILLMLHWMALRTLIHETLVLKNLFAPQDSRSEPSEEEALGAMVGPFRAPILDGSSLFTEKELLGHTTTLLFVRPGSLDAATGGLFAPLLHSIWSKRAGPVCVVCTGTLDEYQTFSDKQRLGHQNRSNVEVLFDADSTLRELFAVSSALRGVVVSPRGRITRVGGMDPDQLADTPTEAQS